MGNATKILNPTGGVSGILLGANGGAISIGGAQLPTQPSYTPTITGILPKQLLGLVPLFACTQTDCREIADISPCYFNPVFANYGDQSTYKNDLSTFFVDYRGTNILQFVIQKDSNNFYSNAAPNWTNVATITDNTYGIYYALGNTSAFPTYAGVTINWGNIYNAFGAGIYRLAINQCAFTKPNATGTITYAQLPSAIPPEYNWQLIISPNYFVNISYPNTSTEAQILAYICALINASGLCSAVVSGNNINITGIAGTNINLADTPLCTLRGGSQPTETCTCALISQPFLLKNFDCNLAHGTTKFEAWNTGTKGDVNNDGSIFNLCNFTIYDSIRCRGFFGYTEFGFDSITEEWGINNSNPFGQVDIVRDKAVRGYKWNSYDLPQWFHDRFSVYALMAKQLLVSDYNRNNSDYLLKQRQITKSTGAYKPEYKDANNFDPTMRNINRTGKVSYEFKQGIQSLISSIICQQTS